MGGEESTPFILLNHIQTVWIPDGFTSTLVKDMVDTSVRSSFSEFPMVVLIYEEGFKMYNYPKNI